MALTVTRKRSRYKSSDVGMEKFSSELVEQVEGGVRKKQIFQGTMRKLVPIKLNILVISEFWPSIVVGCDTNPSSKLWLHCSHIPLATKEMFPAHASWIEKAEVSAIAEGKEMEVTIIQGTGKYCEEVLSSFGQNIPSTKLFTVFPAARLRAYTNLRDRIGKWYKLRHDQVGGVSNSRWLIGVGKIAFVNHFHCLRN